ncbi:MAG: transposase [Bacteroides xylanisolvens]
MRLLNSIKGIGTINAMNTIIHTNNFQAFETARQYACYLGIAPFEHSSGTSIKGKTRGLSHGSKTIESGSFTSC